MATSTATSTATRTAQGGDVALMVSGVRTEPGVQPVDEQSSILSLGLDAADVRCCLLESISGRYRLGGWLQTSYRHDAPVDTQVADLLQQLQHRLHRPLWSAAGAMPFVSSDEPVSLPPLGQVAIAASPHSHLRTWLAGITQTQSVAAAQEALAGSPAQVVGVTLYSADLQVGQLAASLSKARPDLVVVAGGYDFGDSQALGPLYELARLLAPALAREAPAQRPAVIFCGNRWAGAGLAEIMQAAGAGAVEVVENIQPQPGLLHAGALVRSVNFAYWRLCRRLDGMREISRWVTAPGHLVTLESSFAQLVQVWMELLDLPELHALYCAPAWWLHVGARQGRQGMQLRYVQPGSKPGAMAGWPPLQLVSGEWPQSLWPRPAVSWWDRLALAPLVAAVGQVAPQAMIEVLRSDLLEPQAR